MTFVEIVFSQLLDPFRIGLMIALVVTAERTRAATGTLIPLVLGVAFVALMIPMTLQASSTIPLETRVLAGLVSNAVILAVALAGFTVYRRIRS